MIEMVLCCLRLPTRSLDKAPDELFFTADEINHSALRMTYERYAVNVPDGDGIRDFKFTVTQIRSPGTENERKIVRDAKMLPVVHAHPDKQVSVGVGLKRPLKIVVFKQESNRGFTVGRRNVVFGGYR
jgi:hypothetical protein